MEIYNNNNNIYKQQLNPHSQPYINNSSSIYSPNYANYMGIKPVATTSAKINFNGFMSGLRKI